jgi:hypothetical protein
LVPTFFYYKISPVPWINIAPLGDIVEGDRRGGRLRVSVLHVKQLTSQLLYRGEIYEQLFTERAAHQQVLGVVVFSVRLSNFRRRKKIVMEKNTA